MRFGTGVAWAGCLLALVGIPAWADKAAAFFDDTKVHEIRLYFDDTNWYNTLYAAHSSNADDPYFPAKFQYGDTVIPVIGARFKGNASFRSNGVKKSFKLDFNEYDDEANFLGMKKLNLNNGDLQPDMLREKMFLDFAGRYIAAMRAVYCKVYVNDVYWGLYVAVEQPDKAMMKSRYGDDQDGNLYEAAENGATMAYRGADAASYTAVYELKTNEEANDYSGLIRFLDVLNNTASAELPPALEPVADVDNLLYGMALNNLFTNLDSYVGSASEYYLYQRSDTGQFSHIHWDLNESFGSTGDGSPRLSNPYTLDPFYLPTTTMGGPGVPGGGASTGNARPLLSKLWAVDEYKHRYLQMMARMLREGFNAAAMEPRMVQLRDLIRADYQADTNKLFTMTQFENALNSTVQARTTVYGPLLFVTNRYKSLRTVLDGYAQSGDLRLNELMSVNYTTVADEAGDYEPWAEIYNVGPGTLDLTGYYLSDEEANPAKWALPARKLADGGLLTVWLDGEPAEGEAHASFRATTGATLWLSYKSGDTVTTIDSWKMPDLGAGVSLMRAGYHGSNWVTTSTPTPGAENVETAIPVPTAPVLKINEFLADNKTVLSDPAEESAYEDWVEIYNPGGEAVDMSGMYLSDSKSNATKYRIPEGVVIPAKGYLLFWADDESSQGPLHASFKLSADGEDLVLTASDGVTVIDSLTFGKQAADVSQGRTEDGAETWSTFTVPTPGAANLGATALLGSKTAVALKPLARMR